MRFNFRLFFRLTYLALFKAKDTPARLTPKRILILAAFYVIFPLMVLVAWIGWLLDDILFWGYHSQEIRQPVFIVGNGRSGTTFLHRLMAKDTRKFTIFRMWEIVFAPSITQRKAAEALAALDRRLGGLLHRIVAAGERHSVGQVSTHPSGLLDAEEDNTVLLYIWSTVFMILAFFPFVEELLPYLQFDTRLPPAERERVMTFYEECVRRHIHVHGGRQLLSKNPTFSSMIDTLYKTFPDAKIVYMVRSPLNVLPSLSSHLEIYWQAMYDGEFTFHDEIRAVVKHWYEYPLERLGQAPQDSYIIVKYDDLARDPDKIITEIYNRFEFDLHPEFAQILKQEAEKARSYRSTHSYSLEQADFTREQIVEEFQEIFDRFGFDK